MPMPPQAPPVIVKQPKQPKKQRKPKVKVVREPHPIVVPHPAEHLMEPMMDEPIMHPEPQVIVKKDKRPPITVIEEKRPPK
mmetsp:Transcript_22830/g.28309  ORF Transcript_22830/g.28309 Transcript_22830/m.28309 type:complete len:81 (-) Transcript_22830:990-1232(-)